MPSDSHRALDDYDIMWQIFRYFSPSAYMEGEELRLVGHRATLAKCARTSKSMSLPALDMLWQNLPSLYPLLAILEDRPTRHTKDFLKEKSKTKRSTIKGSAHSSVVSGHSIERDHSRMTWLSQQQERLAQHARRVYRIQHTYPRQIARACETFPQLSQSAAGRRLMPNLTYFRSNLEPGLDMLLPCLAGPALHILVIDRPTSSTRARVQVNAASRRIVSSLPQTCPHLHHLHLRYQLDELGCLAQVVGRLHNLRTLHVACERRYPRITKFLHELSGLPFLSELAMPLGNVDPRAAPIVDGFLQLRRLVLECSSSSKLRRGDLLQAMPPLPRLEELKLRIPPCNTPSAPQVYASVFSAPVSTLTTIRLEVKRNAGVNRRHPTRPHGLFHSLQSLHNLQDLEVSLHDIVLFTDDDLLGIAGLWPRLAKLKIHWSQNSLSPTYTTVVDFIWEQPHLKELRLTSVSLNDLRLQQRVTQCGWRTWSVSGFLVEEDRIRDPAQLANVLNILFPHLHAEPRDYAGARPLWREVMRQLDRLWIERHTCSVCNNVNLRGKKLPK